MWLINSNQEICYRCSGEQDSKIASVLYGITCRVKVEDFPNFDPVEVNADETSSLVTISSIVLVLGFGGLCGRAQQTNLGNITGSVGDTSGATIPDAQVVAVNSATGLTQSTVTTSGGLYNINLLPIGRYTVTVTKAGFQKATRPEVAVIAGQTFTVDFVLQAGEQRQQ